MAYCNSSLISLYKWKASRHDGVIKWKYFACYWPFVRGIHRSRYHAHYDVTVMAGTHVLRWHPGWIHWLLFLCYRRYFFNQIFESNPLRTCSEFSSSIYFFAKKFLEVEPSQWRGIWIGVQWKYFVDVLTVQKSTREESNACMLTYTAKTWISTISSTWKHWNLISSNVQ